MNKKKQAGQALLLAAALVLAGCPGSPFQRTYAEAEPSARKTGAWKNPSPEKPAMAVHWTASSSRDGVYRYFFPEENPHLRNGTLNVASHYLVDRDYLVADHGNGPEPPCHRAELVLHRHRECGRGGGSGKSDPGPTGSQCETDSVSSGKISHHPVGAGTLPAGSGPAYFPAEGKHPRLLSRQNQSGAPFHEGPEGPSCRRRSEVILKPINKGIGLVLCGLLLLSGWSLPRTASASTPAAASAIKQ